MLNKTFLISIIKILLNFIMKCNLNRIPNQSNLTNLDWFGIIINQVGTLLLFINQTEILGTPFINIKKKGRVRQVGHRIFWPDAQ